MKVKELIKRLEDLELPDADVSIINKDYDDISDIQDVILYDGNVKIYPYYDLRVDEDVELRNSANKSTRAACDMRTILRRHGLEMELTVETRQWIKIHDAADARRIAEENAAGIRQRTKQRALDKLTLEERRVLGL